MPFSAPWLYFARGTGGRLCGPWPAQVGDTLWTDRLSLLKLEHELEHELEGHGWLIVHKTFTATPLAPPSR